jgi:hypothetical protein
MAVRITRTITVTIILLASTLPPAARSGHAQRQSAPRPDSSLSILRLERGRKVSTALHKGATFHGLEARARRVTAIFEDAIATSERSAAGNLTTRLTDRLGNPLATLTVDREVGAVDRLEFRAVGELPVHAAGRQDFEPTLDWAGRQAHAFFKDRGAQGPARSEWQEDLLRRGQRREKIEHGFVEVKTEWPDGITATAQWREPRHQFAASPLPTGAFTTFLRKDGVDLGWVRWNADEQVLAWSFVGSAPGYLNAERLGEIGGWPFTPDMAWANVQAFAFYELPKARLPQAAQLAPKPGLATRLMDFFIPALHAQNGCDYLHWLDGTIFRVCCDRHDLCYVTYGCSDRSWFWPFAFRWQCTSCNVGAVFCFNTIGQAFHQYP